VIKGAVTIADERLQRRDAIGVEEATDIDFEVAEDCRLLVIDVPMH
jgi:hypothetical protein